LAFEKDLKSIRKIFFSHGHYDHCGGLLPVFAVRGEVPVCAHPGMINIIQHANDQTGKTRIHGLIGGTHLGFLGPDRLEASIAALKKFDIDFMGVSHCTGMPAASRLSQVFGSRFRYGYVGSVFEV